MGNEADNKFTWVIKNFSALITETLFSDQFVIGGCEWYLLAFPKGNPKGDYLCVSLMVADAKNLPSGWRRRAKLSFTMFNQIPGNASQLRETQHWFEHEDLDWGFGSMIHLGECKAKNVRELKIVVEVEALEVIGQSVKKIKLNDGRSVASNLIKESQGDLVDLNGFHILPSQLEIVSRIFEKYPDISLEFRAKNQHLRTACMNVLLSLIKTLCQSPQELSNEDLLEADNALDYVKDAGFKVDWLVKKLAEVKEKKVEEETGETRMQELEEELRDFKQKCSDIEALLEKEKAKVLAARAHITLDEFV